MSLFLLVFTASFIVPAPRALADAGTVLEEEIHALRREASALEQLFIKVPELVGPSVVTIIPIVKVVRRPGYFHPYFRRDSFEDFLQDDFFERFFNRRRIPQQQQQPREPQEYWQERGLGSGVIVDSRGYILTNNHVVAGADELKVRLANGKELKGKIVGTDPKTDLAVVKVEADNLRAVKLGDSDELKVGSWVMALGSPLGLEQTVTVGIVSAKGRGNLNLAEYEDFIQTDAAINRGNSGGPLVNLSGELVGINTAIASYGYGGGYQGVGFAIPINMAKMVMDTLISGGKVVRAWLGVGIQPLTEDLAESLGLDGTDGVLVSQVFDGYPAAEAGIKAGDVIVEYNGKLVEDVRRLRNFVAATPVDSEVRVGVIRDGEKLTFDARVVEYPDVPPGSEIGRVYHSDKLGITVRNLAPGMAESLGVDVDSGIVAVSDVEVDGQAASTLKVGDIVWEYNKKEIKTVKEFEEVDNTADLDRGVLLRVLRDGDWFYIVLKQ